jgi:hypothetical protein
MIGAQTHGFKHKALRVTLTIILNGIASLRLAFASITQHETVPMMVVATLRVIGSPDMSAAGFVNPT